MLKPVSTTLSIVCIGHAALYPYALPGSAVSAEAKTISRAASEVTASAERSQALFGAKSAAIAELSGIASECSVQGWDGCEAAPISSVALRNAECFVRALPDGFPLPEFAPEPDGSISLDWVQSQHRLFSLSMGMTNRLAFAWLDGSDRGHGVIRFDGFNVPPRLLDDIRRIVLDGDIAVRVA